MGKGELAPAPARQWGAHVRLSKLLDRRPGSLKRLLASLRCSHYLGDTLALTFSLEAGADEETAALAHEWPWPHGPRAAFHRATKGGLIAAVVESWLPSGPHSYGVTITHGVASNCALASCCCCQWPRGFFCC